MTESKPTAEELQANLDKALVELDQEPEEPTEETTPEEEVTEDPAVEPVEEKEEEVVQEPEVEPVIEEEEKKETEAPDTETRYKELRKESTKLKEDNDIVNQAIREANALPDPTDEELAKEFTDWEVMSETEKTLAKKSFINERRFNMIAEAEDKRHAVDEWNNKIADYIENPKTLSANPELEGKEAAFKEFATRKEYRGNNLNLIVGAFITDQARLAKEKQVANRGKQMETGKGGDKAPVKPKDEKLSVEDSAKLRATNYPKYKELLLAGKISLDVE